MRSSLLCLAILLTLSCAAHAEQGAVVVADASADATPGLDLSFDPAGAAEQRAGPVVTHADPAPRGGDVDGRFSVDVNIKTRREIGSPAARATSDRGDPATLADKVEDIVERSMFGVTGTYRF